MSSHGRLLGQTPVDALSGAAIGIDYEHHKIHEGDAFCVCEGVVLGASTREYLVETADSGRRTHMVFAFQSSLDLDISIFEATTKTTGTALTERNRNRNFSDSATTVITHTPGGSGDGNLLASTKIGDPTSPGGLAGGGASSGRHEWVLKGNEKYLVRITSASAGCRIGAYFDWYEHTGSEA